MRLFAATVAFAVLLSVVPSAPACTCFSFRQADAVYVGRNYDWDFSDGLVLVNKRGLEKSASLDPSAPAGRWVARHGSVTFNQYGRDFPTGGVNEAGLVVEVLWLGGTVFPPEDDRMALSSLQWIQYELDTAATVDELIASLERIRVRGSVEVHFFAADRSGATAAIEFLEGKPVVHRSRDGAGEASAIPDMPVRVLTNHTYEASESFLKTCESWGGTEAIPSDSPRSLPRFGRAASRVREMETLNRLIGPDDIFGVLRDVTHERTQWTIVYDLANRRVEFKTASGPAVKTIRLSDLDFSCRTPVRMLDVDRKEAGDVRGLWSDYTHQVDRDLIGRSYAKTEFLKQVPKEALDGLAAYPETARCRE